MSAVRDVSVSQDVILRPGVELHRALARSHLRARETHSASFRGRGRGHVGTPGGGSCWCRPALHADREIRGWTGGQDERASGHDSGAVGDEAARVVRHYGYGQAQPAVEALLATLADRIEALRSP